MVLMPYNKFYEIMDKGDKKATIFCKHFWHCTHSDNLVSILEKGFLCSRNYSKTNNIPILFDNIEHNETTYGVMSGNWGDEILNYVRLYFRTGNSALSNLIANDASEKKDQYVILSISRNILEERVDDTILHFGNAKYLTNAKLNRIKKGGDSFLGFISVEDELINNIEDVYSSLGSSDFTKNAEHSECLVKDKIPISFIDGIYFKTKNAYNNFISKIANFEQIEDIKKLCKIDAFYFYRYCGETII